MVKMTDGDDSGTEESAREVSVFVEEDGGEGGGDEGGGVVDRGGKGEDSEGEAEVDEERG